MTSETSAAVQMELRELLAILRDGGVRVADLTPDGHPTHLELYPVFTAPPVPVPDQEDRALAMLEDLAAKQR